MTISQECKVEKTIVARLMQGEDILEELENLVSQYDIQAGQVNFIGAVSQAKLGYFDLHAGEGVARRAAEEAEAGTLAAIRAPGIEWKA